MPALSNLNFSTPPLPMYTSFLLSTVASPDPPYPHLQPLLIVPPTLPIVPTGQHPHNQLWCFRPPSKTEGNADDIKQFLSCPLCAPKLLSGAVRLHHFPLHSFRHHIRELSAASGEYAFVHSLFRATTAAGGLPVAISDVSQVTKTSRPLSVYALTDLQRQRDRPLEGHAEYLWHGTAADNLQGILAEGLSVRRRRVANGRKFGDGLYLSDCSEIAGYFATGQLKRRFGYIFLCRVRVPASGMALLPNVNRRRRGYARATAPVTRYSGRFQPTMYRSGVDGGLFPSAPVFLDPRAAAEHRNNFNEIVVTDERLVELTHVVPFEVVRY